MKQAVHHHHHRSGPLHSLTVGHVGAKGADVLCWKPNITWGKDRGKNPPGSPSGEDRENDKRLTLAEKRGARGEA
jgi:hypothetical protein